VNSNYEQQGQRILGSAETVRLSETWQAEGILLRRLMETAWNLMSIVELKAAF
jgi:hypothetical protein